MSFLVGQVLESRGRYQEIVDFLKPEIARLPAGGTKPPQIAQLVRHDSPLPQLRRHAEPIAAFPEAAALVPDDPVRQVLLIQGYSAAGRHKEAIETAEKALATFSR